MKKYNYGNASNFSIPELEVLLTQRINLLHREVDLQEREFLELQIEEIQLELAML